MIFPQFFCVISTEAGILFWWNYEFTSTHQQVIIKTRCENDSI
ncbi:hypothetical protein HMPREF1548_03608 [Clostridium sp. KLE 1755]|nr:hypothetical protein HMPREF1548_03608 [Clostridium sp. KLE 1755]